MDVRRGAVVGIVLFLIIPVTKGMAGEGRAWGTEGRRDGEMLEWRNVAS